MKSTRDLRESWQRNRYRKRNTRKTNKNLKPAQIIYGNVTALKMVFTFWGFLELGSEKL